ncbi:polysaccharide pyruvyl transferase family protein [Pseudokineococcus sp. 1T1Z-3]|uniref:polysaccharide pyruvyl transferase family protein n=1 Tax=Pseudokineococcus sp. 1T1Z-3 TaxID=3132745 RepID=UPI0030A9B2CB
MTAPTPTHRNTRPGRTTATRRRVRALAASSRERVFDVYASPRLLHPLDRLVLARASRRRTGTTFEDDAPHLLVCPPGAGNVGDQAMVEAFLRGTVGPVVLLVRDVDDVEVPSEHAARVRVLGLRDLVYGGGPAHVRDVARFAALLGTARSVSVVGADLMDGGYGHRPASHLAFLVDVAARRGLPSRVLGFSWSATPHRACVRALARAGHRGTRLLARDPQSAQRMRDAGMSGVEDVVDTVFSAADDLDPSLTDGLLDGAGDAPVVVVNASGLVGARMEQLGDYVVAVEHLRRRGALVVLLPHVQRPGGDDVAEVRRLADRFAGDPGVLLVDGLPHPAQVRGLVDRADAVLTGRMHLAVMALSRGVPAVCLSTQGKVDGLMEVFGTPTLSVPPRPGMGAELARLLDDVLDGRVGASTDLRARAAHARTLSGVNFTGLDAA